MEHFYDVFLHCLEAGSLTELKPTGLAGLAVQPAPGSTCRTPPQDWGYRYAGHAWIFPVGSGNSKSETQDSMLAWQAFLPTKLYPEP